MIDLSFLYVGRNLSLTWDRMKMHQVALFDTTHGKLAFKLSLQKLFHVAVYV